MEAYKTFLQQARAMHKTIIAKATKAADEWLAATEQMLDSMPRGGEVPSEPEPQHATSPRRSRPAMAKRIRAFIRKNRGQEFTSNDVRDAMIAQGVTMNTSRRAGVSTILSRLARRGLIELRQKGAGSVPSTY